MGDYRDASSVGNVLSNQVVIDMREKVFDLEPSANPLLKLLTLSKRNVRKIFNPKFEHLEDETEGKSTQANSAAGFASNVTSIVVDDGSIFSAEDLVKVVETGEQMLVTAVSSNTLTVTRGAGETSAAAITDNDTVLRLGSAYTEGDGIGSPNITKLTTGFNYTQIFRTPFSVTETARNTRMYSGNELKRLRAKKAKEHALEMERQFLFGERYGANLTGNNPRRATRGLIAFISTNSYAAGGALTEDEFEQSVLESAFRYGSDMKVLLASARLISVIDGWGRDRLRGDEGMTKALGLKVNRYNSTHGDLKVIRHKMLEGTTYTGYGIIVDPKNLAYAPLRNTALMKKRQSPGDDEMLEEWLTEAGLDLIHEKTHSLVTGVTS